MDAASTIRVGSSKAPPARYISGWPSPWKSPPGKERSSSGFLQQLPQRDAARRLSMHRTTLAYRDSDPEDAEAFPLEEDKP
jgi:hypothetical protein